ncbi:unnamed protein product, partial [Owenia fusiformis]
MDNNISPASPLGVSPPTIIGMQLMPDLPPLGGRLSPVNTPPIDRRYLSPTNMPPLGGQIHSPPNTPPRGRKGDSSPTQIRKQKKETPEKKIIIHHSKWLRHLVRHIENDQVSK